MKRAGLILIVCGVVLIAGIAAWSTLAVSNLVKFPLSTDVNLQYTGHFVTFVDARTGAALRTPASVPLDVHRTIKAVGSESTSSVAIVDEDITLNYGGTTAYEHNVYAIDRKSMANVSDSRAFTFAPGNPSAAVGSYYVTLPMNIVPGVTVMNIWKPETGTTYPLRPIASGMQPGSLDGLAVKWFSGVLPLTPVASYERASLIARGLPSTIAPSAVEAELSAEGISVSGLTAALAPKLTPTQLHAVLAVLKTPIPLRYYSFASGLVAAEPTTGAIIALKNITDGIAVSPATGGIHTLIAVMAAHRSVAGVPAALAALQKIAAAPPQPVYELRYTQTPAAITTMVNTAQSQLNQIRIVTYYVPIAMGVVGLLLILGGVFMRRRRTGGGGAVAVPGEAVPPPGEPGVHAA